MDYENFLTRFSRDIAPALGKDDSSVFPLLGNRVAHRLGVAKDDGGVLLVYLAIRDADALVAINAPPLGGYYDLNMTWREYLERNAAFGNDYEKDGEIVEEMGLTRFGLDEPCSEQFLKAWWDKAWSPEAQACDFFYHVDFQEWKRPTDDELEENPELDENDWGRVEIVEGQYPGSNKRFVCVEANDPVDYLSREFYRLGIKAVIKEWVG